MAAQVLAACDRGRRQLHGRTAAEGVRNLANAIDLCDELA